MDRQTDGVQPQRLMRPPREGCLVCLTVVYGYRKHTV